MSTEFTGRIALVTGASRGIGRAAAVALGAAGAHVILLARTVGGLEETDDEIRRAGGKATLIPADLGDFASIDQLGPAVGQRFGRLDGLAACAGALGTLTPAHQISPALMDECVSVNFLANHRLIRALHPLLAQSDAGRAVFLTSGISKNPRAYWGPYAASKAALDALVLCYAGELNVTSVKANLFNPGPTRTAMRAKAFPGEDPMTLPAPEEVAPAIADMLAPTYAENGAWVQFKR